MNSPQGAGQEGVARKCGSASFHPEHRPCISKASRDGCPTWIDAAGRLHSPAGADARIVSLVPPLTELVFGLGLGERLVGRTGLRIPARGLARRSQRSAGRRDVNLARIRTARPRMFRQHGREPPRRPSTTLAAFVPYIVVTHPNTPQDNSSSSRFSASVFGAEGAAAWLAHELRAVLDVGLRRCARRSPTSACSTGSGEPWMTVARDTYIAATLAEVGWSTLPSVEGGETGAGALSRLRLGCALARRSRARAAVHRAYRFPRGASRRGRAPGCAPGAAGRWRDGVVVR